MTERALFLNRLHAVTGITKRLPIRRIPEQLHVAFVRNDMISARCRRRKLAVQLVRIGAPREPNQSRLACLLPSPTVTAGRRVWSLLLSHPRWRRLSACLAIAVRHEVGTTRSHAWPLDTGHDQRTTSYC